MKTLIAFATKYGATEKCAKLLADKLNDEVDIYNVKKQKNIDLSNYDKVIIGSSVYMGKARKEISEFCLKNIDVLKDKKVGLFICCMQVDEDAIKQVDNVFPQDILDIASKKDFFGGEFNLNKMNFMERMIVKKVAKIDKNTSNILTDNINNFAEEINNL